MYVLSMPTRPNKHSLLCKLRHSLTPSQLSRHSMRLGRAGPKESNTGHLRMRLMQRWQSSTNTIKRLQSLMPIFWPCVRSVEFTVSHLFAKFFLTVLHPERKMSYFEKHWDKELRKDVLTLGREAVCSNIASTQPLLTFTKFKNRYKQLEAANSTSSKTSTMPPVKRSKTEGLLREADSDDSDDEADVPEPSSDPWTIEFEQYMNTNDIIPLGMAVVAWWGVCAIRSWFPNDCVLIYYLVQCSSLSDCKFTGS